MTKLIDYYLSPSSPWTYLGHARLVDLASRHRAEVHVKPIDLGGRVFPVSGGLPLKQRSQQRQAYRLVELRRWSALLGKPLNLHPKYFPVATDTAARLIIATDLAHGSAAALELGGRVMAAVWSEEGNIADVATLTTLAASAGFDGAALLTQAGSANVDARYDRYTREAIERGVFGAPFYFYRDEPFWGQDRLDFLERALAST